MFFKRRRLFNKLAKGKPVKIQDIVNVFTDEGAHRRDKPGGGVCLNFSQVAWYRNGISVHFSRIQMKKGKILDPDKDGSKYYRCRTMMQALENAKTKKKKSQPETRSLRF